MRITFIEPAPPGFHIYSFIKQVRLGLPLLATLLRDRGHDVRVCVEALGPIDWQRVMSSDVVGVSTTTSTSIRAYQYAERVRQRGIPVVMGGPHVTFEATEALEFCDYVVRGEGEDTMLELVDYFEGRRTLDSILGLSYHDACGQVHKDPRPLRDTISDLPWPDLSLVDRNEKINPVPVLTSRGCPHDCEFCSVIMMFGRRVRRVDNECILEALERANGREVFFYDDNFIMSKPRTKALLAEMIRRRLHIPFSAQIRVDSVCRRGKVDHELLQLLKGAGCYMVYLGLESANQDQLDAFNKNIQVSDIGGGLEALRSYGILTHGMFVLGADEDTLESIKGTVDFAIENQITSVQFLILTPLPGTRQYDFLEREGRIFSHNWTLYDGHHVVYQPKHMSPWELQRVTLDSHQRFYRLRRLPTAPKYRGMGFAISHGWERVPENMAYMRELRAFSDALDPSSILTDGVRELVRS
jgi:anaerobic magnesium-protoporphyrin IX monomethyl ester cyclase